MNPEEFKLKTKPLVRVRIAPAPTGFLHIGTARTALFNFLFAKQNQGVFVLRVEDTDKERSKPVYERDIIDSLNWLGIEPDEGPEKEGKYGPYRQSERREIYKKYIEKLLNENKAYYCFCSKEELEAEREYQLSIGQAPHYSGKCSNLEKSEVQKNLDKKKDYVIRFRTPDKKVKFEDLVRGEIEFDSSLIGDITIAKNKEYPLYNLACVIDDFEMKISHIIRGEDHISNTPKQILLQQALDITPVKYAHLPLILGTDKTKLSKRHGATSILEYRNQGYLSETMVNFMAFMGWNPGTEKEIYYMPSLIKDFSLERVQKAGAVFNVKKLNSLNGFYIRKRTTKSLAELCVPYLIQEGLIEPVFKESQFPPAYGGKEITQSYKITQTKEQINIEFIERIVAINQQRLKTLNEITELTDFFFAAKLQYEKNLLIWNGMTDKELILCLDSLKKIFSAIKQEDFNKDNIAKILLERAEKFGRKIDKKGDKGYMLWPLRVALTGKKSSAGPFDITTILGKEKTLKRIGEARELI